MSTSEALTEGIRVGVEAEYSPEHSQPSANRWFFLYTITITNESPETVQLISRHWTITDATGEMEEVRGLGVVGDQPVLEPRESYQYTSGCPLPTPFGSMQGSYQFVTSGGSQFNAQVARFELRDVGAIH